MTTSRRPSGSRRLLVVSAAAFVVAVVALLVAVATGDVLPTADSVASVTSAVFGAASLVVSAVFGWIGMRSGSAAGADTDEIEHGRALLARHVLAQWTEEIGVRRLTHPRPLRLRWRLDEKSRAVPGAAFREGLLVDPRQRQPASRLVTAFRSLRSPQLVIKGAPGSGKSTVAMLFTVAATPGRAGHPVPVLLPLADWRPHEDSLRAWAARSIEATYPALSRAVGAGHETVARALLDRDEVLLVLDGLDEMPAPAMRRAVELLGDTSLSMVITCREEEYAQLAAAVGRPPMAAEVTISPLRVEDAIDFLTPDDALAQRWARVVDVMRADPDGPVASALSTPLMISLARNAYAPESTDPAELIDPGNVGAIERLLLDRLLPAAFPAPGRAAEAERWLGTIARHLRHRLRTPNLTWWNLAAAVPRSVIVLSIALTIGLAGALICVVVHPFPETTATNAQFGGILGLSLGAVAGLNAGRSVAFRDSRRGKRRAIRFIVGAVLRDALCAGLITAAWSFTFDETRLLNTYEWDELTALRNGLLAASFAAMFSLMTGALSVWRGSLPTRTAPRLDRLFPHLWAGLGTGVVLGLPVGLLVGTVVGILNVYLYEPELLSAVVKAGAATGGGIAAVLTAAVGVPLGIGRWLSATVDDDSVATPRATLRDDVLTSLIISVTAALSGGAGVAVFAALTAQVAGGESGQRTALIWFGGYTDRPEVIGGWAALAIFGVALLGAGSPWVSFLVARAWLALWGRLPWKVFAFLEQAHQRAVLRQVGPIYQFRHDRVEHYFAVPRRGRRGLAARLAEARAYTNDAASARSRRFATVRRVTATVTAALLVPGAVGALGVPVLRERIDNMVELRQAGLAANLRTHADDLQEEDPDVALRLRVAAAEIEPESLDELGRFMQLRQAAPGSASWYRLDHGTETVGQWTVGLRDGAVLAWNLDGPDPAPMTLRTDVAWVDPGGPDTLIFAVGKRIGFWRFTPDAAPATVWLAAPPVDAMEADTDGWLAVRNYEPSRVTLWSMDDPLVPFAELDGEVVINRLAASERWLVAETDDRFLVWDLDSGSRQPRTIDAPDVGELTLRGNALLTGSFGDRKLWNLASAEPPLSLHDVNVDLSPDGRWVLVRDDGIVAMPTSSGGHPVRLAAGGQAQASFTRNGSVVTEADRSLTWFDMSSAQPKAVELAHDVANVEGDLGDDFLVAVSGGGWCRILDLRSTPPTLVDVPYLVDPDQSNVQENVATIAGIDGSATIWKVGDGIVPVKSGPFPGIALLRDDLVWGADYDADRNLHIVNLDTRRTFPLGGRAFLVEWGANTVLVHVPRGVQLWTLDGPRPARVYADPLSLVDVSGSGAWMSTFSPHGQLMVTWRLDTPVPPYPDDPRAAACAVVPEPLTRTEWKRYAPDVPYHETCREKVPTRK